MTGLFEDAAVVLADAFEDAVAVEEAVIINADLGLMLGLEFPIQPDQQIRLVHKSHRSSFRKVTDSRFYPFPPFHKSLFSDRGGAVQN